MTRTEYTLRHPCPVCAEHTKGCNSVPANDGVGQFYRCRGASQNSEFVCLKEGANGFRFYRRQDDLDRAGTRRRDRHVLGHDAPLSAKKVVEPKPIDPKWRHIAEGCARSITDRYREEFARRLGIPTEVLAAVPLLGHRIDISTDLGGARDLSHWTIPETNHAGEVVGVECRYRRELIPADQKDKKVLRGCNRGLVIPSGWRDRHGPGLCFEGLGDTLAAVAASLSAVSRPGAGSGGQFLSELFRGWPADRDIIIVGDNDKPKKDGSRPGQEGAIRVATAISESLNRPVKWSIPPDDTEGKGYKDARDWLQDGGPWSDLSWSDRGVRLLAHLVEHAVTIGALPDFTRVKNADDPVSVVCPSHPYCTACDSFNCSAPSFSSFHCGARASISNAEQDAVGIHARAEPDPILAGVIGSAPRSRPCRFPKTKLREGSHALTLGTFDILKATCGKCGACQEKRRYAEKVLHCTAAHAIGTHVFHQENEEDWHAMRAKLDRVRKKIGREDPFPFARCIQEDGRRFVVLSLDDVPPSLLPADLISASSDQCARLMSGAIDSIPFKLPKHTTRIQSNEAWKLAGGQVKQPKQEAMYTDLGTVEPHVGADLNALEEVALSSPSVVEVVHSSISSDRIEGRIIVRCKPDTEHEVFRALFPGSLSQLRRLASDRREVTRRRLRERVERERLSRQLGIESALMLKSLRETYRGREHELTGLLADLLA